MKPQPPPPRFERLARWQAAHKQLLQEDAPYLRRHTSYLIVIVGLGCLMLPFYLPYFGIRLFGFVTDVSILSGVAAVMVFVSIRQWLFQNQKIHKHLQSPHGA